MPMTFASLIALTLLLCSVQSTIIGFEIVIAFTFLFCPYNPFTVRRIIILCLLSIIPGTAIFALIYLLKLRFYENH